MDRKENIFRVGGGSKTFMITYNDIRIKNKRRINYNVQ